jgi:hypothetical protein
MTTQQVYSIPELQANLDSAWQYLRNACANLGHATDPDDVELAAVFVESAGTEIERCAAALGAAKNG